jgi:hypothetical protein
MAQTSTITLPLQPPPPPKKRPYTKKLKKWIETWVKTQKEAEYKWKKTKKGMEYSIREHIGKFIDRLTLNDIAELMATIALTPLVKKAIDETEKLRGLFFGLMKIKREEVMPPATMEELRYKRFLRIIVGGEYKYIEKYEGLFPDWMDWLISFGLAYLIVHNFGTLIHAAGDVVKSVQTILLGLVGTLA